MNKFVNVGTVIKTKTGKFALALGKTNNKNEKYNYSVEFVVKDHEGKVLHTQTNGFLNLFDPRKAANITEERLARIPDSVRFEVSAIKSDADYE